MNTRPTNPCKRCGQDLVAEICDENLQIVRDHICPALTSPTRAYIIDASGNIEREVKNLGWLLTHWKDVTSFEVIPNPGGVQCWILRAALRDGRAYRTDYASASVLRGFLDRPVFRGLLVTWHDGQAHTIGSDTYRGMRESWEKK